MANDRRTGILGDQIEDGTITKDELLVVNDPPLDKMVLGWDSVSQKFKWYNVTDITSNLTYYVDYESESSTTSTSWQDKISYTIELSEGYYEFAFQSELARISGAIQNIRMLIDDVEYCYHANEADFTQWKLVSGFKKLFINSGSHTIQIQFCSGTNNRGVKVRRTRLHIITIGN